MINRSPLSSSQRKGCSPLNITVKTALTRKMPGLSFFGFQFTLELEAISNKVCYASARIAMADFSIVNIEVGMNTVTVVNTTPQLPIISVEVIGHISRLDTPNATVEVGNISIVHARITVGIMCDTAVIVTCTSVRVYIT